jgi:hypothetical protein
VSVVVDPTTDVGVNQPSQIIKGQVGPVLPAARKAAVIDPGIRKAVELFQNHQIETFESCEGGYRTLPSRTDRGLLGWARSWLAGSSGLYRLRAASSIPKAGVGRTRNQRADRPTLGNNIPKEDALAELDALFTERLASVSVLTMFRLNFLALETIFVIVMDFSVLRRFFY